MMDSFPHLLKKLCTPSTWRRSVSSCSRRSPSTQKSSCPTAPPSSSSELGPWHFNLFSSYFSVFHMTLQSKIYEPRNKPQAHSSGDTPPSNCPGQNQVAVDAHHAQTCLPSTVFRLQSSIWSYTIFLPACKISYLSWQLVGQHPSCVMIQFHQIRIDLHPFDCLASASLGKQLASQPGQNSI